MARSASAMRPGSSMRSIAMIFASVIVNAWSEIGLASAALTMPTAPLIKAGKVTWADRRPVIARAATAAAPRTEISAPLERTTTAGATGQLAGRGGRAPDDGRDVAERDGEHVVQDEGEPLGGRQRVQDYQ